MQLRSWLSDALRALSQVREDYSRRRAYVGRHWISKSPAWAHVRVPSQMVIRPWSEQAPDYDLADIRWGEALKRMSARRSPALAMQ